MIISMGKDICVMCIGGQQYYDYLCAESKVFKSAGSRSLLSKNLGKNIPPTIVGPILLSDRVNGEDELIGDLFYFYFVD